MKNSELSYQELRVDVEGPLDKLTEKATGKLKRDCFSVNDPKLGRFHLLLKIHKRLYARGTCNFKLEILHRKYFCRY